MGAVLTLAWKDLRILFRDRFAMFWILAFPVLYAVFFGVVFGDDGGDGNRGRLSLALVDGDDSTLSAGLIERLAQHDSVVVDRAEDGSVVLTELEAARESVRKGRRTAYVAIPAGFGDDPWALFAGKDAGPTLEVGIDPSRKAEAGFLQGVLMEVTFGGMADRFTDKAALSADIAKGRAEIAAAEDLSVAQKLVLGTFMGALDSFLADVDMDVLEEGGPGGGMEPPFEVVEVAREKQQGPRSSFDITFPQSMAWGLMSVALGFAVTLVRERTGGTLLRLHIAPLSPTQVLAGKALACFVACLGVMLFVLLVGVLALGLHIDQPLLLTLPMLCTAVCFTGLMMTVSVMGKTENAVAGASWGLMMPFAMIGGGMIPLIAMPDWMQTASNVSFFKWAIIATEGAVWRGFSLPDMALPCGVLLAFGAGFFALGVFVFRRMDG